MCIWAIRAHRALNTRWATYKRTVLIISFGRGVETSKQRRVTLIGSRAFQLNSGLPQFYHIHRQSKMRSPYVEWKNTRAIVISATRWHPRSVVRRSSGRFFADVVQHAWAAHEECTSSRYATFNKVIMIQRLLLYVQWPLHTREGSSFYDDPRVSCVSAQLRSLVWRAHSFEYFLQTRRLCLQGGVRIASWVQRKTYKVRGNSCTQGARPDYARYIAATSIRARARLEAAWHLTLSVVHFADRLK